MKSSELIQQLINIPITEYLASIGVMPTHQAGQQWFYRSPKTNEKTPSLTVNPNKNVFFDWSGEGKGDIVSLVRYLNDCTFLDAVLILEKYVPTYQNVPFSLNGQSSINKPATDVEILDVKPLQHKVLFQYITERGISLGNAFRYLREVHYQTKGKRYFAIGFPNDSGGYEVRNQYFKGSFAPKAITTFGIDQYSTVLLFEGFFDFLSALEYYKKPVLPASVIVLNSLTNLSAILPDIQRYKKVSTFFDSDASGRKALYKVQSATDNVTDFTRIYEEYKDFNEMLCTKLKRQS